jgi:hypothetical protein
MDLSPDAPHSPDRTREAADLAAEALRYLNHATRDSGALEYPNDAAAVLASLATLASRLPQLLSQISDRFGADLAAGRLTVEYGPYAGDPRQAVAMVRRLLGDASANAGGLSERLDAAHQVTAAIGVTDGEGTGC